MRQQFQYPWKQKQKHFIIREITLGKYSFQGYSCHKICLYIYFVRLPAQWLSKSNGQSKSFVYRTFFILFQSNSILSSVPLRFICLPPSMHYFNTFPLKKTNSFIAVPLTFKVTGFPLAINCIKKPELASLKHRHRTHQSFSQWLS